MLETAFTKASQVYAVTRPAKLIWIGATRLFGTDSPCAIAQQLGYTVAPLTAVAMLKRSVYFRVQLVQTSRRLAPDACQWTTWINGVVTSTFTYPKLPSCT